MKDGLRFVDCDMHIMEPPDLFERYLDPSFKDRVILPVGAGGRPVRGTIVIDGLPRMCISTDYPHFDSNFPNVSSNLQNVPREIAAEIFMGGAHLYGFTETDFQKAAAAATAGRLTAVSAGR